MGRNEFSSEKLTDEAHKVVATKVAGIVHEVRQRALSVAKREWPMLSNTLTKTFGFTGAAITRPQLLASRIYRTLPVGKTTRSEVDSQQVGLPPEQFVLQATSLLAGRWRLRDSREI